jgi:hypothetical protein
LEWQAASSCYWTETGCKGRAKLSSWPSGARHQRTPDHAHLLLFPLAYRFPDAIEIIDLGSGVSAPLPRRRREARALRLQANTKATTEGRRF